MSTTSTRVKKDNVGSLLSSAMEAGEGLLRLTPTWVPRSFLHPGKRIKLPRPIGTPTVRTAAASTSAGSPAPPKRPTKTACRTKALSFVTFRGERFTLRDAVAEAGRALIGKTMFDKYKRWPVYSKFFDNMGPIPHHMHQGFEDATLVGQEGKPESYYFPPQLQQRRQQLRLHVHGPRARHDEGRGPQVPGRLEQGRQRHPRSVAGLSPQARHRLADSARRAARARFALHLRAAMGLRRVRHVPVARRRPRSALVAAGEGHAEGQAQDLDFIVGQLDWEKNVDTHFKEHNYLEPIVDKERSGKGYTDRWIVYGTVDGQQLFSAKELTLEPGAKLHAARSRRQRLDHGARPRPHGQARHCKRRP